MTACRVATWNCWWQFGDWQRRWDAIAAVLVDTAPDVLGLQEVWVIRHENAAAQLADRLGMHCSWAPSPHPGALATPHRRHHSHDPRPVIDIGER